MNGSTQKLQSDWPALPLDAWIDTRNTFHRYCQVVGKVRLGSMPFRNHWWHVALYVDTRGITTGPMPTGDGRSYEIAFDLVEHRLLVTASDGAREGFVLADGLACMDFHERLFGLLARLGLAVVIDPAPYDIGGPPLSEDREHRSYDAEALTRYWNALRSVDAVLAEFAGWFNGKQSPVHLFWHSFDLALTRFSGRPAPPRPGADEVSAEAYSHEAISFGFWPGDANVAHPAFYSYTAPAPPGLAERPLRPASAVWDPEAGTAYLPYEDVRTSASPRETLLEFLTSAYTAGATTAGWDIAGFATRAAPRP